MVRWKRNLYVISAAELVAMAGFTVIIPFLPYYVQELGVTDPDQVKLWSGWLGSVQSVSMVVMAPIWGVLADRYGRKLMVERAMFGGCLIFLAMGFAKSVEWLLVLRFLQGAISGTVPAATALVASSTPRNESGRALGLLQTGIYLGATAGPLMGGVVADTMGYQAAFWVNSACQALAGLAVHTLVAEATGKTERLSGRRDNHLWDGLVIVIKSIPLRSVFAVRLVARIAARVAAPMLPLFIQDLVGNSNRLATITGTVSGVSALAGAAGAVILGKKSDEIGHRKMLLICSIGLAISYVPQAMVNNVIQLGVLQLVGSFLMAGILASIAALLAKLVPEGRQGAVYGVNTTIVAAANAIAPPLGAAVAIWFGLRPMFWVAAGLFLVASFIVFVLLPDSAPLRYRRKHV